MKPRIVIADDDDTIISLVSFRLGLAQFEVLSAHSGAEALDLIRKIQPVVAILDVWMPGGGGLAALATLKSDPATRDLPVLMLSGERDSATVMSAMRAGADDYLVKPFKPDLLLERVNKLMHASAMVWGAATPSAAPAPSALWEL